MNESEIEDIRNSETLHEKISDIIDPDDVMNEDEIVGIQLYPSGWPRKIQITVKSNEMKENLIIKGIDIFGKHIEMRDESNFMIKVVVKDAPLDWSNDTLTELFELHLIHKRN